jgi:hypothetical protein
MMIRFSSAPGPLDNPLKGWCSYIHPDKLYQPYSMFFRYVPWRKIEPAEGRFAFEEWEKETWDVPKAKGKHIVFRVFIDYPSQPSGLPDYLRARGVQERPVKGRNDGRVATDYDNPVLVAAMERMIAALGQRYDNNPRVAFIQLGFLGFWGEWHTIPQRQLFANPSTQRRIVDAYRRAFRNKKLMARNALGYVADQDWIGFHDDYFPQDTGDEGPKKQGYFLYDINRTGRSNNWKQAVIGGEMVPFPGNNALKWLGNDKDFAFTMKRAEEAHFSWIGPYSPAMEKSPSTAFLDRSQQLVRRMGYEYCLKDLDIPDEIQRNMPFTLTLNGENQGVAPFYYRWPIRFALLNDQNMAVNVQEIRDGDIRTWLPGKFTLRTDVRFDASPGTYRLAMGIIDPWSDNPAIGFANDLARVDGWNILGQVKVV